MKILITMNKTVGQQQQQQFVDTQQQQQQQQVSISATNNVSASSSTNNNGGHSHLQTHLTKFAFLLSSARGEGSDEPVVGMLHDVEMAACFSKRHIRNQQQQQSCFGNMSSNINTMQHGHLHHSHGPPSISSSSLSMAAKNGHLDVNSAQQLNQIAGAGSNKRAAMLGMAAMNMSAPFYTTPDTVETTAKTILKNIVTTMDELMDSRLRSTVSQLVQKAGTMANSQLVFKLLSPSRNPIQVATVITRFVVPENTEKQQQQQQPPQQGISGQDELLSIPLQFKAILDVKVFGEVSTVELSTPVTMSGKFDINDGLLTAVDVSFDCVALLKAMIAQARIIIKTAVTKAVQLSVQIAEWHAKKKTAELNGHSQQSTLSLHSLLGSSFSLGSLTSLSIPSMDGGTTSSTLNGSLFSMTSTNKPSRSKPGKGLLRQSSYARNNIMAACERYNAKLGMMNSNIDAGNNANATFDFGSNNNNNNNNIINSNNNNNNNSSNGSYNDNMTRAHSMVRFRIPEPNTKSSYSNNIYKQHGGFDNNANVNRSSFESTSTPSTSSGLLNQQFQQQQQPDPQEYHQANQKEQQQPPKGNIHKGLFSWIEDDDPMFLTEENIKEQNEADAERERELRDAPMPLRFFTAAQDLGGGECAMEMVSKSIFGNGNRNGEQQEQQPDAKRQRLW